MVLHVGSAFLSKSSGFRPCGWDFRFGGEGSGFRGFVWCRLQGDVLGILGN